MTLLDRIRGIWNRGVIAPRTPQYDSVPWPVLMDADGSYFSANEALKLSVVWACVSVISRSIASCDWKVYQRTGERTELLEDDGLGYLLSARPNPETTAMAFKEALLSSALVYGNGYAEIVRDGAGRVVELWNLDPERTEAWRDPNSGELGYRCLPPQSGEAKWLPASKVYHLRGPSLNGLTGDNLVLRAAKTLVLSAAADTFATAYYSNNTVIGGVLEYPRALDERSLARLKADWVEKHAGPKKAYKPLILENGMAWKPFNVDAGQSQMLEARRFQVQEICRWFAVPPYMVGDQAASVGYGTNLEQTGLEFQRSCLGPFARRMEQEADYRLLPARGPGSKKYTRIDLTPLSRGDAKTRADAYNVLRGAGVLSVNEIRRLEGLNAIGSEGDIHIAQATTIPLHMLEQIEQAKLSSVYTKPVEPAPAPAAPGAEREPEDDQEDDAETETDPEALAHAIAAGVTEGSAQVVSAMVAATGPLELEVVRDDNGRVIGARAKEG